MASQTHERPSATAPSATTSTATSSAGTSNAWMQALLAAAPSEEEMLAVLGELGMTGVLPGLPAIPEWSLPDVGPILATLPELPDVVPDFGSLFPDLESLLPDVDAPAEGPVVAPGTDGPAAPAPPVEEALAGADGLGAHLAAYLDALDRAFRDPGLAGFTYDGCEGTAARLRTAWAELGAGATRARITDVTGHLHAAAAGQVVADAPVTDRKAIAALFGKLAGRFRDTYALSRVLAPEARGLEYPTAAELGVPAIDLEGLLSAGDDGTAPVGADGAALDLDATVPDGASVADRAAHLAGLLRATTLPPEWMSGAHDDVAVVYDGSHAAEIAAAGLPSTAAEVNRALQAKVQFANQKDNVSREEEPSGGTCNLTAVAMAMQAAGIVAPDVYRGIQLGGMQYEERLLTIANADGRTSFTTGAVWEYVVRACGGQFETIQTSGEIPWATWQVVQTEHLDRGHGVIVSNNGHVVRLQQVDVDALVVDDPYAESDVRDTGDHPGKLTRTYVSTLDAKSLSSVVLTPVWRLGGTYYAEYVDGAGASPYTEQSLDEACLELLRARVDDPATWKRKGDSYKSDDRPSHRQNAEARDRAGAGYDEGRDTRWERDSVTSHWMGGVYGIWR